MSEFLKSPVFADADQTQAAAKLHIILWTLAVTVPVLGAFAIVAVGEPIGRLFALALAVEALALAGHVLNRAGRTRWASLLVITGAWLIITGFAITAGGLASRGAWGYFIVVFIAGITLGNWAGVLAAGACSLTALGLAYAALAGLLPPTSVSVAPLNLWVINTLYLTIAAGLQYLASRFMQESLQRARQELAERQRAEGALRQSEQRFRAVFENSAIGVALNDLSGHALVTNAATQAFLGYSAAEMAELSFTDYSHPEDAATDLALYRELAAGQRDSYHMEKRYHRKDGAVVWGRLTVSLVRDASGAPQFAVAISEDITERKQAEAALQQYAARMEILHEIDRDVLAARSAADTARVAVGRIRALVNCDRASVFLLGQQSPDEGIAFTADAESDRVAMTAGQHFNLEGDYGQRVMADLRQGKSVAIEDIQALNDGDPNLGLIQRLRERSWLHLPLQAGGELLGALNLARAEPGAFSAADRDIAQEVADQLAIAIRQARLLAETTDALRREQRLNEVTRTISGTLDWQTVVQAIMPLAAEVVGASGSLVGLLTGDDQVTYFPSFFNTPDDASASAPVHKTFQRGEGLIWQLIETRQPMRLDDYGSQPGALPDLIQAGVHALLAVPIIAGDRALGGLGVFDRDPGRRFTARDQAIIESIGRQAGLAIQNARLFEAERTARLSADALVESAQVISSALSLPEVLERILTQVKHVIPAVTGVISTEAAEGTTVLALLGYEGREARVKQVIEARSSSTPLMRRVMKTGRPILIPDAQADPDWVALPEFGHIRCFLAAPILGRQGPLGVLTVDGDRPHAFTPQHMAAVQALAAQAGIAIENARLFESTRRQLSELVVLHAGAMAATAATSEDALIERATQIIGENLYSTLCGVALVDPERQVVRHHPSYLGIARAQSQYVEVPMGERIVGTVALRGLPWRIPDVRLEPKYVAAVPGMLSEVCVPLKAGERTIGVINVESSRLDAFSEADERLLVTYAGLLATAIVRLRAEAESRALNKLLEQRVQARTRELSALYDVSELASQLLDLPAMVSRALARVLEAVDSGSGAVFLLADLGPASAEHLLGLTVQHGLDPTVVDQMAQSATHGLVWQVVSSGQPVIWPEAVAGGLVCVGMPMNVSGAPLGVLSALRAYDRPFNVEELALLASTADALAVSIENVRLRQQAEETAVAVERDRLARDLHDSVTQALYSLTLFAEAGRRLVHTDGSADTLEHYLTRLGETSRQALKDMRLLIHNLRPAEFAPEDLIGALRQRLEAVESRAGVEANLIVEGLPIVAPAAAEALYRIAQEALNNALKHSAATSVRIRLYNGSSHTVLEITDNGRGFKAGSHVHRGGLGLRNMQTRAQQLGGTFAIRSEPGAGTTVVVSVPDGGT